MVKDAGEPPDSVLEPHAAAPVHVGGLEPLSTGELHHHFGLLNGIRFIYNRIIEAEYLKMISTERSVPDKRKCIRVCVCVCAPFCVGGILTML